MEDLQESQAHEITRLHHEIEGYFRQTLDKAIEIGRLLVEQKSSMKHGGWNLWLQGNVPFTGRTARNYMRLYHKRDRLKTETVSDLKTAYQVLKVPKHFGLLEAQERTETPESFVELSAEEWGRIIENMNAEIGDPEHAISTDTGWIESLRSGDDGLSREEAEALGLFWSFARHFCFYSNLAWESGLGSLPGGIREWLKHLDAKPLTEPIRICRECRQFG